MRARRRKQCSDGCLLLEFGIVKDIVVEGLSIRYDVANTFLREGDKLSKTLQHRYLLYLLGYEETLGTIHLILRRKMSWGDDEWRR
jgi:hypothetical protein